MKNEKFVPCTNCSQVSYVPKILRSMVEICKTFGVGRETVQGWAKEGAPIVVEGGQNKPRYSTECLALQAWRVQRSAKKRNYTSVG